MSGVVGDLLIKRTRTAGVAERNTDCLSGCRRTADRHDNDYAYRSVAGDRRSVDGRAVAEDILIGSGVEDAVSVVINEGRRHCPERSLNGTAAGKKVNRDRVVRSVGNGERELDSYLAR